MKQIRNIKKEDILAIDIETVRYEDDFNDLSDEWQSAWEYKNKQDGEIPTNEELTDMWVKRASLYAEFSKVCAVSLAYHDGENLKCKSYKGEDEKEILNALRTDLNAFANDPKYRLIGHASKYYDFPFLSKRYIANGIEIPFILDTSDLKPWEHKNLCTNELWRSFGTGPGSSLQALCKILDVPISKVDLVGDEVGAAYFNGEIDRISSYCDLDTIAVWNIFQRFKGEEIVDPSDAVFIKQDNQPLTEQENVFKTIYGRGYVSQEDEKFLLEKAKSLAKKDRENLVEILKASLGKKTFEQREEGIFDKIIKTKKTKK